MTDTCLPAAVPSGFPGAGEKMLLSRARDNRETHLGAGIAKDISETHDDAEPVPSDVEHRRTEEALVDMSNGCICTSPRDDQSEEVKRRAEDGQFDDLPVQSKGISDRFSTWKLFKAPA